MGPKKTDSTDFLLRRGRMASQEHEQILQNVLRKHGPSTKRKFGFAVLGLTAAFALVLVAGKFTIRETSSFAPKGQGAPSPMFSHVACLGGTLAACPQGSKLVFRIETRESSNRYLAAFAEPAARNGERIWYFPLPDGRQVRPTDQSPSIVDTAVRVGPEHRPGRYRVHVLLTRNPVQAATWDQVAASAILEQTSTELEVTP
jgi:hypothetical protein